MTPASLREVPFERLAPAPSSIRVANYEVTRGEDGWRIVASMGEQPTGGYAIRIRRITVTGQRMTVTVERLSPPPGSVNIQVITYPSDAVRVKASDLPSGELSVVFQDQHGVRLAERSLKN